MKQWIKYTIAGTVLVIGVGGSITYNQYLEPVLNDEWVLVASTSLDANAPLQNVKGQPVNHAIPERLPRDEVSPNAIEGTDPSVLNGLYTSQSMSRNEQFTSLNLQDNPFTVTPGTNDVPIPVQYIAMVSPTLRKGDYVKVIPITIQNPSQSPQLGTGINQKQSTLPTGNLLNQINNQNALDSILVLSVHTNDNQEVVSSQPQANGHTPGTRDNGTGTPGVVDLKLTDAQAQTLTSWIQQGNKLFIWGSTHKNNPVNQ